MFPTPRLCGCSLILFWHQPKCGTLTLLFCFVHMCTHGCTHTHTLMLRFTKIQLWNNPLWYRTDFTDGMGTWRFNLFQEFNWKSNIQQSIRWGQMRAEVQPCCSPSHRWRLCLPRGRVTLWNTYKDSMPSNHQHFCWPHPEVASFLTSLKAPCSLVAAVLLATLPYCSGILLKSSENRLPGFEPWLCHTLAVWQWASYLSVSHFPHL